MKDNLLVGFLVAAFSVSALSCKKDEKAKPKETNIEPTPVAEPVKPEVVEPEPASTKIFMDMHKMGPGKITAAAVAEAHQKDLAVQEKHGVNFKEYWVDEASGTIYCLAEAPSADAIVAAHKEAHGGVPEMVTEMVEGEGPAEAKGGDKATFFMDTHEAGPGKITAAALMEAHQKDVATQEKHGVNFMRYWFDEASGKIHCLAEAPNKEAVIAAHKEAHGAVPAEVVPVAVGQ